MLGQPGAASADSGQLLHQLPSVGPHHDGLTRARCLLLQSADGSMGVNVGLLSWGELERAGRADSREGEGEIKEKDRAGGGRGGARLAANLLQPLRLF